MISLGMQGPVKSEDQVKALHIYVDKMDVPWQKLLLMALYESHSSNDNISLSMFECGWCQKMAQSLNTIGWKNVDNLHAYQNK